MSKNILVAAFSCSPTLGSEPGIGWGVVRELSRQHRVWLITDVHNREYLEPSLQGKKSRAITVCWVKGWFGSSDARLSWLGHGLYYLTWQCAAYRTAKSLSAKVDFDLVFHATYGCSWLPSFLGWLGVPFIWCQGLPGGIPMRFYPYLSWYSRAAEMVRGIFRSFGEPLVRLTTAGKAAMVLTAGKVGPRGDGRVRCFPLGGLEEPDVNVLRQLPFREAQPFRVISVGRLISAKGLPLAMHAFAEVWREDPTIEYWIVGEGPEKRALERLARTLGCADAVSFLGWRPRDQLWTLLAGVDVLLHLGLRETFGYAVAEAMAAGRPVIALDVGGPAFLGANDAAILIPPDSPRKVIQQAADALRRLCSSPQLRRAIAERGRRRILEDFVWPAVGKQLRSVCESVSASHPPR